MVTSEEAKKALLEIGYRVDFVAEKIGVKPATLRRWLNGYGTLSKSGRILVGQILKIDKAG
jgi:transposase-like protein